MALAPDLFDGEVADRRSRPRSSSSRQPTPNDLAHLTRSSLQTLRETCRSRPTARSGVLGFSMGASMALWLAARVPDDRGGHRRLLRRPGHRHRPTPRSAFLGHFAETTPTSTTTASCCSRPSSTSTASTSSSTATPAPATGSSRRTVPSTTRRRPTLAWERTLDLLPRASSPPPTRRLLWRYGRRCRAPGPQSSEDAGLPQPASRPARSSATKAPRSARGWRRRGAGASSAEATTTRRRARPRRAPGAGVEMPKPMITGRSVVALRRLASTVDDVGQRRSLPGDPEQVDAVDEALRAATERCQRLVGRERRRELHGVEPASRACGLPLPQLLHREVGQDHAGDARRHRLRCEPLVAGVEHEVHVGHHHERDAGVDVAQRVEDPVEVGALAPGRPPTPPGWSGRPSPGRRTGCRPRWRRRRRRRRLARPRSSRRRGRR